MRNEGGAEWHSTWNATYQKLLWDQAPHPDVVHDLRTRLHTFLISALNRAEQSVSRSGRLTTD